MNAEVSLYVFSFLTTLLLLISAKSKFVLPLCSTTGFSVLQGLRKSACLTFNRPCLTYQLQKSEKSHKREVEGNSQLAAELRGLNCLKVQISLKIYQNPFSEFEFVSTIGLAILLASCLLIAM